MKHQSSLKPKQVVRKVVEQAITNGSIMPTANSHSASLTASNNGGTIEERIRIRAHQLYQERGSQTGHDIEDWLQAEREILASV